MEYWIYSDMSWNLAAYVAQMAEDAIKAILQGDEDALRRYLSCQRNGYNGRDCEHPVIRGNPFGDGRTGASEAGLWIVGIPCVAEE